MMLTLVIADSKIFEDEEFEVKCVRRESQGHFKGHSLIQYYTRIIYGWQLCSQQHYRRFTSRNAITSKCQIDYVNFCNFFVEEIKKQIRNI